MFRIFLVLIPTIILCLTSAPLFSQSLYIKGGLDVSGDLRLKALVRDLNFEAKSDVNIFVTPTFHFETEFLWNQYRLQNGIGFTYDAEPRVQTNWESVGFHTLPLYAIFRYNFIKRESFELHLTSRFGYAFVSKTSDTINDFNKHHGDFYFGFGLMVEQKGNSNLVWEVLVSRTKAHFEKEAGSRFTRHDYTYRKVSISVGKRFSF